MKKYKIIIVDIATSVILFLFVYAALSKIQDFEKFRVELGKSPILNAFSHILAVVVPSFEVLLSVLLVIKRYQLFALYASFSLMVMFSAYIIVILKFSPYIPCSCGGILQNMTWNQHLVFNAVFVLLSAWAILIYPNQNQDLIGQ